MGYFAQWVLGVLLIIGGVMFILVRIGNAFDRGADQGWWGGWFAILCGWVIVILGVLVIALH